MASWTDGPEYAPLERPAAFETPAVEPLDSPATIANPADGQPAEQPWFEAPNAGIPLERLIPPTGPSRNPSQAFDVVTSSMTSAWGSAHSTTGGMPAQPTWNPHQPLMTTSMVNAATALVAAPPAPTTAGPMMGAPNFPPPQSQPAYPQHGTPDWFSPPPSWQADLHTPRPVTVAQMWQGATPGVMIPLLVGLLVGPLSIVMLSLGFALSSRVKYRRKHTRRAFSIASGILGLVAAMSLLNPDTDLASMWGLISVWAQIFCGILPIAILLIVGAGIRAGEPPERQN